MSMQTLPTNAISYVGFALFAHRAKWQPQFPMPCSLPKSPLTVRLEVLLTSDRQPERHHESRVAVAKLDRAVVQPRDGGR
jgi:hypothetical protein